MIGLGAAGGTAVLPLAQAGLDVVGLEAGGRFSTRDYPADEIRNDIRNWLGRAKVNNEVPTQRRTASRDVRAGDRARPDDERRRRHVDPLDVPELAPHAVELQRARARRSGATAPARSRPGSTLADWPLDYDELEPYYDKVEFLHGVSGKAGNLGGTIDPRGNVFEGPRAREYPLAAAAAHRLHRVHGGRGAPRLGWHPFPGPAAIRSRPYNGLPACEYHGFCTFGGCHVDAKGSTNLAPIPQAEKTGKLKVVEHARVLEIVVDDDGLRHGRPLPQGGNAVHFQPAKAVLLAGYTYENTRLLLLSKSPRLPERASRTTTGRSASTTSRTSGPARTASSPGRRLNRFSGTASQWTAVDDFDSDFFDHAGLGFIGGGTMAAGMEVKPIGAARTTPPTHPALGLGLEGVAEGERDLGRVRGDADQRRSRTRTTSSTSTRSTKDPDGVPVVRVTNDLHDNERRAALFVQGKVRRVAPGGRRVGGLARSRRTRSPSRRTPTAGRGWATTRTRTSPTGGASRTRCRTWASSARRTSPPPAGATRPRR